MTRLLKVIGGTALILLMPALRSPEPLVAFACGTCGNRLGGHTNPFGGGQSEGIHATCVAVAGCPHPDCAGGHTLLPHATDFERILVEVEAGAVDAPRHLLKKYPGTAEWNRERRALQLRAPCFGDGYVGHIPLTDAQARRLAD